MGGITYKELFGTCIAPEEVVIVYAERTNPRTTLAQWVFDAAKENLTPVTLEQAGEVAQSLRSFILAMNAVFLAEDEIKSVDWMDLGSTDDEDLYGLDGDEFAVNPWDAVLAAPIRHRNGAYSEGLRAQVKADTVSEWETRYTVYGADGRVLGQPRSRSDAIRLMVDHEMQENRQPLPVPEKVGYRA